MLVTYFYSLCLGMFGLGLKKFPLLTIPTHVNHIHTPKPFQLRDKMSQIILLDQWSQKIILFGKNVLKNAGQRIT